MHLTLSSHFHLFTKRSLSLNLRSCMLLVALLMVGLPLAAAVLTWWFVLPPPKPADCGQSIDAARSGAVTQFCFHPRQKSARWQLEWMAVSGSSLNGIGWGVDHLLTHLHQPGESVTRL
jgi:hypothetical protein